MVQAVRVEPLQPVVHPVYDTVHVTEYQPVKQKVQKPIVEADLHPEQYVYRASRRALNVVEAIRHLLDSGYTEAVND